MILGFFDSGLGGLTVMARVRVLLPQHDMLFFADQLHVPYGDREPGDLRGLLKRNFAWLSERGAEAVVMACNTSCAIARQYGWPHSAMPVLDLIESAAIAVERAGYRRIGVLATAATVRSGAYGDAIRARAAGAVVFEVAAPELVPLVESGQTRGAHARAAVERACAPLPRDLDAVLLACTHYPHLDAHFAAVLGRGVTRIDPAVVQAERASALVAEANLPPGSGSVACVTTGPLAPFAAACAAALGAAVEVASASQYPAPARGSTAQKDEETLKGNRRRAAQLSGR